MLFGPCEYHGQTAIGDRCLMVGCCDVGVVNHEVMFGLPNDSVKLVRHYLDQ